MKKNTNANTNANANTNIENGKEVVTMNKNTEVKASKTNALTGITHWLNVGGNSVEDIKAGVTVLTANGYTETQATQALFLANSLNESEVKLQKAKIYAGVSGNAELMKKLKVNNMSELSERFELGDSKSTISEMVSVYRKCYDKPTDRMKSFIEADKPTYTELVKIISVSAGKGNRTEEEKNKDIDLFLDTYAPKNIKAWVTVSQLRDFVTAFKSPEVKAKDTKAEPKAEHKAEHKAEPKNDYTAIKSVADTSKKDATSAIKQAKEAGDIIENKGKGVTIVNADSVSDFMTKLVNIAKIRGCKPLDLVGSITMTIKDGE